MFLFMGMAVEFICILHFNCSPIDIPNFGGHHRRKNSPLTPPDSDGPDSPEGDQGRRIKGIQPFIC